MLKEFKAEHKRSPITHVVQVGDLLDQYVFSNYSRSPGITPKIDIEGGLKMAGQMWADLKKIAPQALCYQLLGNHCVRLNKRIAERIPELAEFFGTKDLYQFEGVKVMKSDRDFLVIDGVVYCHGWLSKSLDHAKYFGRPTVHGHRHRMAIETDSPRIWSMDIGYLADRNALPLQYTQSKFSKWTLGCGVVEDGKPRLIFLGSK